MRRGARLEIRVLAERMKRQVQASHRLEDSVAPVLADGRLMCQACKCAWPYGGKRNVASCPNCGTSVTIQFKRGPRKRVDSKGVFLVLTFCPHCRHIWTNKHEVGGADPQCKCGKHLDPPFELTIDGAELGGLAMAIARSKQHFRPMEPETYNRVFVLMQRMWAEGYWGPEEKANIARWLTEASPRRKT